MIAAAVQTVAAAEEAALQAALDIDAAEDFAVFGTHHKLLTLSADEEALLDVAEKNCQQIPETHH